MDSASVNVDAIVRAGLGLGLVILLGASMLSMRLRPRRPTRDIPRPDNDEDAIQSAIDRWDAEQTRRGRSIYW